jgi:sulfate transport system substrate-binding protein
LDYLYSPAAQKIYAENGYRPIVAGDYGRTFPTPPGLFTIADLGGWTQVTKDFFDPNNGIVAKIEQANGVATAPTPSPSAG